MLSKISTTSWANALLAASLSAVSQNVLRTFVIVTMAGKATKESPPGQIKHRINQLDDIHGHVIKVVT